MKLGLTIGEPCGIGLELWQKIEKNSDLVLVDDLEELKEFTGKKAGPSAEAGHYCYKVLVRAHQMALNGDIDALITGPVSKESMHLAGLKYNGQTEVLAKLNNLSSSEVQMFFVANDLRLVLLSRHIPLKDAAEAYLKNLASCLEVSVNALEKIFAIHKGKIAICGLNPHAGESGLLGQEELEIQKQIESFRSEYPDFSISEPLAADACLAKAGQQYLQQEKQNYDLYVAAYHDQALTMIKAVAGFKAINLSVGLPYIRVSVDHGTAFDIVGKGKANTESLEACINFCRQHLI